MQLTVYDYFSRALRQPAMPLSGCLGKTVQSPDGATAVFGVEAGLGRIAVVSYRCASCVTLTALCQHLSELMRARTPDEALKFTAKDLLALHGEIPPERRERAWLVVEALHSAVECLIDRENS